MRSLPLILAVAASALMAPVMASAQQVPGGTAMAPAGGPLLTLSVTESMDSAPDIATLSTGVQTRAASAREAMTQNAAQMDKLIAALVRGGVERRDIQTSGINLSPQYDYSDRTNGQPPRFIGYEASNQLSLTIRRIDKAGELIDAMVAAGATNLNGPSFSIAAPGRLLDQARTKAIQTAQARADLYAQATGYQTARLIAISEGGNSPPPMPMPRMAMAAQADSATQVEPGQVSSSITLSVQFVLER